MNEFHKILEHDYYQKDFLQYIQQIQIGIAGVGGLGSNIFISLVRSGFVNFEIVDFDCVESSNLNRQYFFKDQIGIPKVDAIIETAKRINPDLLVIRYKDKLNHQNINNYFKNSDIIFEAFDIVTYKKMIFETFGASEKVIVCGSGMAGLSNDTDIRIRKLSKHHFLVGDEISAVSDSTKVYAPRVIACASLMSSVVLEKVYLDWLSNSNV